MENNDIFYKIIELFKEFTQDNYMGTILRALKIRIYPTPEQQVQINKTIGSCRFIYNSMLAEKISIYEKLKDDKRKLYEHKYKTEKEFKQEFEWLKEVDSIALQ